MGVFSLLYPNQQIGNTVKAIATNPPSQAENVKYLNESNKHRTQTDKNSFPMAVEKWFDYSFTLSMMEKSASVNAPVRGLLTHLCSKEGRCIK